MGVTAELARFIVETDYDAIPQAAIESTRFRFLDTLGCMLAGADEAPTLMSLDLVRALGGTPSSSIAGHPDRTSAPLAAFVNGVSAHCLEYDDYTRGANHFSVTLVPTALALAEQTGASGRQMVEAFAIGFQVATRIAWGVNPNLFPRGWHPNNPVGTMGAAAVAAKLLGLDAMQTRMAFGIATAQLAGARANFGSMTKAFHVGHAARSGIFAAMLAKRGFTAYPDIIEGSGVGEGHERFGLGETYVGRGKYNLDNMLLRLNEEWELAQNRTFPRLHPCATTAAPVIDAVIDLAVEHDLRAEDIERIDVEMTAKALATNSLEPHTPFGARFSIPYGVAVALIDRACGLAQYTEGRIARGDVQSLLPRVHASTPDDLVQEVKRWGEGGVDFSANRLAIVLKNGTTLRASRKFARGWPEDPASWNDIVTKYEDCARGVQSAARQHQTIDMVSRLEALPGVADLAASLQRG